jgi:hypothetical protein
MVSCTDFRHFFQTAKTGAMTEYARNEETFSPIALDTIGEWILSVVAQKNK